MPRTPRAARTLIRQVRERLNRKPDSKAGQETAVATDEPDGFGVHREFTFDKVASKGLVETLTTLGDPRILSAVERNGQAVVTFTGSVAGDDGSNFGLDDVALVAEQPE